MEQTWKLEAINKLELAETTMIENFSRSKVSRESAEPSSYVQCKCSRRSSYEIFMKTYLCFLLQKRSEMNVDIHSSSFNKVGNDSTFISIKKISVMSIHRPFFTNELAKAPPRSTQ